MRIFEKSYSLIFGKSAKNIATAATIALAISIALSTTNTPLALLYYAAFGTSLFLLMCSIDSAVVNQRRCYYVAVVSTLLVTVLDLLFRKPPLTFALVGAATTSVVIQSLKCKSYTFTLPLVLSAAFYLALSYPLLALVSIIYTFVTYSFKQLVNKITGGLDAMCIFSSFLYAVFAEDDVIEDAFKQLGIVEKVPLHLYLLGGRHVALVSEFHPGPFRHIGGGMLVDKLNKAVEEMGYGFTFIHGVGSHERDPVTKRSVEKIVNAVRVGLTSMQNGSPPRGISPMRISEGDVKTVGLSLGTEPHLAVVSRINSASDDIPLWVARQVDPGFYLLVDAQNKFDGVVKWSGEDVKSLANTLERLHESQRCERFLLGFGKENVRDLDPLGHEIGPAGISAIVTDCDGRKSLLIVIDGNNLDYNLYKKLTTAYEKRGYEVVEVITTDTHRATGVGFGRGYRVVGERINHDAIFERVERAVARAEREMGPHAVSYVKLEVEAEVLGEEGFRKIKRAVEMYKRVGGLVIFTIFILPIAVITLLA